MEHLPGLADDGTGPVFREPWEAQAFALAVRLSEAGHFTWAEWTTVLTQQIGAAQARGDRDLGDTYYEHWLGALESICVARNLVVPELIHGRVEQWRSAYLNTRHGQPVELSAAARGEPVS